MLIEAYAGDNVIFSGIYDISIGDTLVDPNSLEAMAKLLIEKPTLQMMILVNDGPFVGRSDKFVSSRQLKKIFFFKELETNVGLLIEELEDIEGFKVSGLWELNLSILLEQICREGFKFCVYKSEVLFEMCAHETYEPFEEVLFSAQDKVVGTVIEALNTRKGIMPSFLSDLGYTKVTFLLPTSGMIGYLSEFIISNKGMRTLEKSFYDYLPYVGPLSNSRNSVFIEQEKGENMAILYGTYQIVASCVSIQLPMSMKA